MALRAVHAVRHPDAELRALSAIDLALWDLLGQATGQPVYRLLGGPVRERIPVYNTCGGPSYGALQQPATGHPGWPGYGSEGRPGPLVDRGPVIERGAALLPEGPGLGTRFHDALFKPGTSLYRRSG